MRAHFLCGYDKLDCFDIIETLLLLKLVLRQTLHRLLELVELNLFILRVDGLLHLEYLLARVLSQALRVQRVAPLEDSRTLPDRTVLNRLVCIKLN